MLSITMGTRPRAPQSKRLKVVEDDEENYDALIETITQNTGWWTVLDSVFEVSAALEGPIAQIGWLSLFSSQ